MKVVLFAVAFLLGVATEIRRQSSFFNAMPAHSRKAIRGCDNSEYGGRPRQVLVK